MSQIIKHGGVAIFCVGLYDFMWHELHVQETEEKMTQALYLSIFQDGVIKTIERF